MVKNPWITETNAVTYQDRDRECCLVRTDLHSASALHVQTCTVHSLAHRQCSVMDRASAA